MPAEGCADGGGGTRTDALDAVLQAEEDAMLRAEQEALDRQPQRPRRTSRDLALPPRDGAHGAHGRTATAPGAAKPAGGGPGDAAARKPRASKEHHGVTCAPPTPPNERRRRISRDG